MADWTRAACRSDDSPDDWILGDPRVTLERSANTRALRVCSVCPIKDACYAYYDALPRDMRRGVIAGGVVWSTLGYPVRGEEPDAAEVAAEVVAERFGTSVPVWETTKYPKRGRVA